MIWATTNNEEYSTVTVLSHLVANQWNINRVKNTENAVDEKSTVGNLKVCLGTEKRLCRESPRMVYPAKIAVILSKDLVLVKISKNVYHILDADHDVVEAEDDSFMFVTRNYTVRVYV